MSCLSNGYECMTMDELEESLSHVCERIRRATEIIELSTKINELDEGDDAPVGVYWSVDEYQKALGDSMKEQAEIMRYIETYDDRMEKYRIEAEAEDRQNRIDASKEL